MTQEKQPRKKSIINEGLRNVRSGDSDLFKELHGMDPVEAFNKWASVKKVEVDSETQFQIYSKVYADWCKNVVADNYNKAQENAETS